MPHRIAPIAESDLDEIWIYTAKESGSIEIANRLTDTIAERFHAIGRFPRIGRSRELEFGPGHRSLAVGEYVIVYYFEGDDALILRVVHGRRDLEMLFGN